MNLDSWFKSRTSKCMVVVRKKHHESRVKRKDLRFQDRLDNLEWATSRGSKETRMHHSYTLIIRISRSRIVSSMGHSPQALRSTSSRLKEIHFRPNSNHFWPAVARSQTAMFISTQRSALTKTLGAALTANSSTNHSSSKWPKVRRAPLGKGRKRTKNSEQF